MAGRLSSKDFKGAIAPSKKPTGHTNRYGTEIDSKNLGRTENLDVSGKRKINFISDMDELIPREDQQVQVKKSQAKKAQVKKAEVKKPVKGTKKKAAKKGVEPVYKAKRGRPRKQDVEAEQEVEIDEDYVGRQDRTTSDNEEIWECESCGADVPVHRDIVKAEMSVFCTDCIIARIEKSKSRRR